MTSNNDERNDTRAGGPAPRTGPSSAQGDGVTARPAQGRPAGTSPAAGQPLSPTSQRDPAASSAPARGETTDRSTSASKARTADTSAGKKSAKSSRSGGDWNVFRTVVVLVGVVIAAFGAYYLMLGTAGLPDTEASPVNPTLESQFRFFSAMMVGVGAAFITIAVKFQWANMLWLVCLMVFVGGIGRVLSWAFSGTPNYIMIILMVVELAFPPALLVWHKYIAKTSDLRREFAERR